ncbi:MAG: hypothetical protein GY822_23275 [Deltaproteobacteria bacterium]|nr:hypothetical protein [Deltaproteobacteria bacterium]
MKNITAPRAGDFGALRRIEAEGKHETAHRVLGQQALTRPPPLSKKQRRTTICNFQVTTTVFDCTRAISQNCEAIVDFIKKMASSSTRASTHTGGSRSKIF